MFGVAAPISYRAEGDKAAALDEVRALAARECMQDELDVDRVVDLAARIVEIDPGPNGAAVFLELIENAKRHEWFVMQSAAVQSALGDRLEMRAGRLLDSTERERVFEALRD